MIDRAASAVVSPTTSSDLLHIMPAMIASLLDLISSEKMKTLNDHDDQYVFTVYQVAKSWFGLDDAARHVTTGKYITSSTGLAFVH